jgi:hypothetical protein
MINKLEIIWKETIVDYSKDNPGICFEGPKDIDQDTRYPDGVSKSAAPEIHI